DDGGLEGEDSEDAGWVGVRAPAAGKAPGFMGAVRLGGGSADAPNTAAGRASAALARQTPPPGLNNKFFPTATVAVLKTTQTWQDMEPESCDCAAVSRPRELSEPSEQLLG
ncbi:MAG: hypothetical protein CMQ61_09600, partial [Gammaproteobacteria bacterium]|nr:hypothetical protein [Gammaproteobacteria bacterium]